MIPSSNDPVTMLCPVCATPFVAAGKRRYCRDACRVAAHRRRTRKAKAAVLAPPLPAPKRAHTVYECDSCGTRILGEQRCDDCGTFMRAVGIGGLCPSCDEPHTIDELLDP